MRDIKFRAWRTVEKYMMIQGTPDLETIESFFFHMPPTGYKLMQYTGFESRSGIEIYEGDFIKKVSSIHSPLSGIFEVKWARAGFYIYKGKLPISFGIKIARDCEVIGNIHEGVKNG